MPGVGEQSPPDATPIDSDRPAESLAAWREAAVRVGLQLVDRRGWDRFVVVGDGYGQPTAVRLAKRRRESVLGLALGHAALSSATTGPRPPANSATWEAFEQLTRQGNEAFVRHGLVQMTQGSFDEEVAQQMVERFPNWDLIVAVVEALGREPEPIGDELRALDVPLLLGKHEGCLGRTDEGFEDIVAAFPEAQTAICPEACSSSPTFAEAIKRFAAELG